MSIKQTLLNHIKNIPGWRTKRKLVVISVDDYGNVRLDSKKARENMDKAGLKVHSRFDAYDTLETREDLEALYDVLTSVKDMHGNHAVFTPFALPCNINFEAMQEERYGRYIYELLPKTYDKLSARHPKSYEGTWELWKEGIEQGVMAPQFHGREHFNLTEFENKLIRRDKEILVSLENRSYTSISSSEYPVRSWTGAFTFWKESENNRLKEVAIDGFERFEEVFGSKPVHFMAPTANVSDEVLLSLAEQGVLASDKPLIERYHLGEGRFQKRLNYTGKNSISNLIFAVRNVVFEPTKNENSVRIALDQIDAAFRMNKPAIISSHRVNFCGLISKSNRDQGLLSLKRLLKRVVKRHPEVEFVSSKYLVEQIHGSK